MRIIVVAASVLLLAVPGLQAQGEDRQVLAAVQQLFDGMRAKDTARMRAVLHPQARMVSAGLRNGAMVISVESPDGWLAGVARGSGGPYDERLHNTVVHLDGPLASVWTDYTFYLGERMSHCGVDTFHLVRTTEGWRIIDIADTRRKEGCTP